ncbi:MAG: CRTAC1 family protein [Bryobacterales bacterium]|nr:CRTAC1 family protein [Bryobacterales bacterium]
MNSLIYAAGLGLIVTSLSCLPGCGSISPTRENSAAASVRFSDVTAQAGIHFEHNSGAEGKKWLPETLGPGCAFFDADGDGWLDILIVNGRNWSDKNRHTTAALYRNKHDGTFEDITKGSGLDFEAYSLGVAIGDYDNDGRDDVYITALEGDRLFHNEGGGHFRDVTAVAGIHNANFATSAAWLDYDNDGKLDLFVANYVQWTPQADLWCSMDGTTKSYCTPESYKGTSSRLYRNIGNGQFADVTETAGLGDPNGKSLGVAAFDYDGDGWTDLFVANDTQPNKLYHNLKNGRFEEVGLAAGVAFGEDGVARAAMGVDAADYDRSGRPHLLVGNFSNQMLSLYHNEGHGLFLDEAPKSEVGRASLLKLTFGLFFFDYDLDGFADILTANGHLDPEIEHIQPKVRYRQTPLLLRNRGGRSFEEIANAFTTPMVGRGMAYGDYDRDGDLDVLIATNNGPAFLYRNDGGNTNHWLTVKLEGTRSNRDGIGAVVRVNSPGGAQWQAVHSGSSYCSSSQLQLTFGLGPDDKASSIEVDWPGGERETLRDVHAGQNLLIRQP